MSVLGWVPVWPSEGKPTAATSGNESKRHLRERIMTISSFCLGMYRVLVNPCRWRILNAEFWRSQFNLSVWPLSSKFNRLIPKI
jgi:hypothetical protein